MDRDVIDNVKRKVDLSMVDILDFVTIGSPGQITTLITFVKDDVAYEVSLTGSEFNSLVKSVIS